MAVIVTDNRTIINEADSTSTPDTWTGSVAMSAVTTDPTPMESTACIGQRNNNTTTNMYVTKSGVNFNPGQTPGPSLVYAWLFRRTVVDTVALGGMQIQLGDGTNRIGFHLGGDDRAGFRHGVGPTMWECFVLDTARLADYPQTVFAGTFASLNLGAITQFGVAFKATVGAQGNVPNTYVDILRRGAIGVGVTITGGSSGDPGTFEEVSVADRQVGNQQAHGVVRRLATGLFGVQGLLRFGEASGSAASWFEDKNVSVVFEDRTLGTNKYGIIIQDNGVATATFKLGTKVGAGVTATGADGVTIVWPSGVGGYFDAASDTDVTDVFIYGSRFSGATAGVKLRAGHEFIGGIISGSGAVEANGATMLGTSIQGSTVAANASALIWNVDQATADYLDRCSFVKGSNAHHAIEFGVNSPLSMTLKDMTFTGFNAANNQNDSTFHIKRTSGTVTINLQNCSGNFSYRSDGAEVDVVINPVALTVEAKDINTEQAIVGAQVFVPVSSGVGGKPYNASVSITQTGGTATVSHTSHNLKTNQKVWIRGANENAYNGVKTITVVNPDSYTYSVPPSTPSPATGPSITSTFVVLFDVTDGNGRLSDSFSYTNDQPISGRIRKATGAGQKYKTAPVSGSINKTSGLTVTVPMIPD